MYYLGKLHKNVCRIVLLKFVGLLLRPPPPMSHFVIFLVIPPPPNPRLVTHFFNVLIQHKIVLSSICHR